MNVTFVQLRWMNDAFIQSRLDGRSGQVGSALGLVRQ